MTPVKVQEHIMAVTAFSRPPVVGDYFRTKTGGSALHVQRVSRIIGVKGGGTYRLQAIRVKLSQLPEGVEPLPWPLPRTRRRTAPPPRIRNPITSPKSRRQADRDRVRALKAGDDPDRLVQQIRINNQSVVRREWRDPDDDNPRRRTAKVVSGYAGRDEVQVLLDAGTIEKPLARIARRFRKEYEQGEVGLTGGRNLAQEPTGFSAGPGPSEVRMGHIQTWRATAQALRPHLRSLLTAVIGQDTTIKDYAQRRRRSAREVTGELLAALLFLADYYKEIDGDQEDRKAPLD